MSKKLIYIRVIIATICLLFVLLNILLFRNIQKSESIDTAVEETTEEEKIVFDIKIPPNKQRRKIIEHKKEYLDQVYEYMFHDKKFANCLGYDYLSSDFIVHFTSLKNLVYYLSGSTVMEELMKKLFSLENEIKLSNITLNDLPVTENYKQKHPKPLYEEFDTIIKKKEDYKHPKIYHGEAFDYWYEFNYDYGVGVVEENKEVCVIETKTASRFIIENSFEIHAPVYDKDRNEVPPDINTMNIYFKYTTDEKGYVDDVVYDRTEIITEDKYLDSIIKYDLSTTD